MIYTRKRDKKIAQMCGGGGQQQQQQQQISSC
jgi:hypothetical protein